MYEDSRPVYLRLRDSIVASILDGRYGDGDMLPSVRAFAAQQSANPLTVAKAYQSFQDEGLVSVRRGVGMFVVPGGAQKLRAMERERFFRDVWPAVAAQMRRLGITRDELTSGDELQD